jgi:ankyrin repeat protein
MPNRKHGPPLHTAVLRGLSGAVRTLVSAGASTTARNLKNQTPLDLAIEQGHMSIENLLRGLDVNIGMVNKGMESLAENLVVLD